MSTRRSGFTDEDDRLAKLLMAEFERVEHRPVTASWVATFADMARAVRLDSEQPPAVPDPTVEALSEAERKTLNGPLVAMLVVNDGVPPMVYEAVERILAARAAAPDALRVRVEGLAAEWEARGRDQDSFYRRRAADLRALLEETQ